MTFSKKDDPNQRIEVKKVLIHPGEVHALGLNNF